MSNRLLTLLFVTVIRIYRFHVNRILCFVVTLVCIYIYWVNCLDSVYSVTLCLYVSVCAWVRVCVCVRWHVLGISR